MSVPLPSASLPIVSPSPAKPKTRPTAIPGSTKDASSGAKDGHGLGQSPGSFSFRRGSRSGGVAGGGQLGSSPAEGNWRERGASLKAKGPERTVGGFGDKKGTGGGSGAGAGTGTGVSAGTAGSGEGEKKKEAADKGDKEKAKGQEKKEDKEGGDKEKSESSRVR